MDTRTLDQAKTGATAIPENRRALVNHGLHTIKTCMPNVYALIQAKAADMGDVAYNLVRRGLAGEAGCFYAIEGGYVVGTPYRCGDQRMQQVGEFIATFGSAYVCVWPMTEDEVRRYGAD